MKSVSPLLVLLLAASLVLGLAACGQEPAPAPSSSILEEQRPLPPSSQAPDSSAESASEPAPSPSSMAEFPPAVPSPSSAAPVSPSSQAPSSSAARDDGPIFSVSTDTVKTVGVGIGALLGLLWEEKVDFSVEGTLPRRILRLAAGGALLMLVRVGLKALLPEGLLFDGLRYACVGAAATGFWPWAFTRLKL